MDMDMSVGKKKVVKPRVGVGARTEIRKGVEGDQGVTSRGDLSPGTSKYTGEHTGMRNQD